MGKNGTHRSYEKNINYYTIGIFLLLDRQRGPVHRTGPR